MGGGELKLKAGESGYYGGYDPLLVIFHSAPVNEVRVNSGVIPQGEGVAFPEGYIPRRHYVEVEIDPKSTGAVVTGNNSIQAGSCAGRDARVRGLYPFHLGKAEGGQFAREIAGLGVFASFAAAVRRNGRDGGEFALQFQGQGRRPSMWL